VFHFLHMNVDLKRYDKMILKLFYNESSYHGHTSYYNKFKKSASDKYVNIKHYIDYRFDNITSGLCEVLCLYVAA
jgi:hypothetical protein